MSLDTKSGTVSLPTQSDHLDDDHSSRIHFRDWEIFKESKVKQEKSVEEIIPAFGMGGMETDGDGEDDDEESDSEEEASQEEVSQEDPEKKEKIFLVVKPDGVQRALVGEIVKRFEQRGHKLVAFKMVHSSKEHLQVHNQDLKGKPKNMSSGPVVAMVWERLNAVNPGRTKLGATNPMASAPGTWIHQEETFPSRWDGTSVTEAIQWRERWRILFQELGGIGQYHGLLLVVLRRDHS